jgi:helicase MOV-10
MESDYQRAVDFLRTCRNHTSNLAILSQCCPLDSCAGRAGAYSRFFRARAGLFELLDGGNTVRLKGGVGGIVGARRGSGAVHAGRANTREHAGVETDEARVVAFLRGLPAQRCNVGVVAAQCPVAACAGRAGAYLRWFRERPHLFLLVEFALGGNTVELVARDGAAPPAAVTAREREGLGGVAGCALCGVLCFISAAQRGQHEGGRRHQRLLAASRQALTRMGISATGAALGAAAAHGVGAALEGGGGAVGAELAAAPGREARAELVLTNGSDFSWCLGATALLPPCEDLRVGGGGGGGGGGGSVLPPGGVARVPVSYAPQSEGSARVLVTVELLRADGGAGATCERVACALQLRCADPAKAAELAALLPVAPFRPPPRGRRKVWAAPEEEAPRLGGVAPLPGYEPWLPPKVALRALDDEEGALRRAHRSGDRRDLLRVLLLLEEKAAQADVAAYDLHGVPLTPGGLPGREGGDARLAVTGLAESRPSVSRGDTVLLREAFGRGLTHRARVAAVGQAVVGLALSPAGRAAVAADGARFDVRFEAPRAPYLVQHAALASGGGVAADACVVDALLAPRGATPADVDVAAASAPAPLPAPPHFAALNRRQRESVARALAAPEVPGDAFIIFGPPGTGKTTTLAEYVLQLVVRARASGARPGAPPRELAPAAGGGGFFAALSGLGSRLLGRPPPMPPPHTLVLVAAPSNAAVDVLSERLLKWLPPGTLLRVNSYCRAPSNVAPALRGACAALFAGEGYALPTRAQLADAWVVAATCITAQRLVRTLLKNGQPPLFSHVCIDEAGQATEPETLCAVAGALHAGGGGRVVLAGDPEQLGPILRSPAALAHGLGVSLLERLMAAGPHAPAPSGSFHPARVVMLNENYRSHAALLAVPNARFYGGALVAAAEAGEAAALARWPGLTPRARAAPGGCPLLFHGVQGQDMREGSSPSFFNPKEAVEVVAHVESVLAYAAGVGLGLLPRDVGVVTPYRKQCGKIKELLKRRPALADVDVGSVELFQGGERRVIVVSTVRTSRELLPFDKKFALGFLDNPKRFNVAVTRARQLLIIVGDPAVLNLDDAWSALLRFAVARGAYRGCELPPGFEEGGGGGGGGGLLQRLRDEALTDDDDELASQVRGEELGAPHAE